MMATESAPACQQRGGVVEGDASDGYEGLRGEAADDTEGSSMPTAGSGRSLEAVLKTGPKAR